MIKPTISNGSVSVMVLSSLSKRGGEGYSILRNFQQYFSYIVVVSFIGGGNQSTRRKSLKIFIT